MIMLLGLIAARQNANDDKERLIMTNFKVNDKIERIEPQTVTGVTREGYLEIDNGNEYHHCPDFFKLSPPKPVYPNAPHKHCAMICHVANGGIVRNVTHGYIINGGSKSFWPESEVFEIVHPKTKDELRIELLQDWIKSNEENINKYKRELDELKLTVHY